MEVHRHTAFRVAYLITGSEAEAEDATQDAVMKAYDKMSRFDSTRPFRPWLLKIVGNEARNRLRAAGRRRHYELALAGLRDVSEDPSDRSVGQDAAERLLDAVNRLPEKERIVVGLKYFLELSENEVAKAAGIPRGTVKSRTSRALRRLRDELGDAYA